MSRAGYCDDCSNWELICWRGAVASAIRGKRGQAFLRELVEALDALPAKALTTEELVTPDGRYCALGAVGRARGMNLEAIDSYDRAGVAFQFQIAESLAAEIMFKNDEGCEWNEPPQARWQRMREWAANQITQSERGE